MKKTSKLIALTIISSALIGSSNAWAANLSGDSLKTSTGNIMTAVSTEAGIGGFGESNGARLQASFRNPSGVTVAADGSLLIADTRSQLIRKLSPSGQVTTVAGISVKKDAKGFPVGAKLDGKTDTAFLQEPTGIAVDANGVIYIADAGNHAIRKIDTQGNVVTLAGSGLLGLKDGAAASAMFYRPMDVAVAADGTVYVADTLNHVIRSISPTGQVATLNAPSTRVVEVSPGQAVASGDFADGDLATAKFNEPSSIVLDAKGNLYVSDSGNHRIRYIDLSQRKVITVAGGSMAADKSGVYEKKELYATGDYADGNALQALFHFPQGLALTAEGGVVIADSGNHSIRYLFDGKVTTLAGDAAQGTGESDGIESGAEFQYPTDVALLPNGSIAVADSFNNKVRRVSLYQHPSNLPQNEDVKVVLNDKWIEFDAQPEIENGRTMVPVRFITEQLGYKVTFDDATRAVQLSKDGQIIELYVGQTGLKRMEAGKQSVFKETDVQPYIKQDRTYVPIRFFAEEIGLDVQWDSSNRTAIIREYKAVK